MSQEKLIRAHLDAGNRITQLSALHRFGCLRLGARIYDLKKNGYPVETEMVEVGTDGKRVAEYRRGPSAPAE